MCHTVRDNGVFRSEERNFVGDSEKFEITMFEITGPICILNYKEKCGKIGFFGDSGKFETTDNQGSRSQLH